MTKVPPDMPLKPVQKTQNTLILEDNTTPKDDQAHNDDEHSSEEAKVATNGNAEDPGQQVEL